MPAIQFWFTGAALGAMIAFLGAFASLGYGWYYAATQEQKKSDDAVEAARSKPRPRFLIEGAGLANFDDGLRAAVTVKYRNVGNTTAHDVTSDISVAIRPYPITEQSTFPLASNLHESKGILAPGQEVFGTAHFDGPLTRDQITQIIDGTKVRLFVAGTLSFRDALGLRCKQRFMFHLGGTELKRVIADKIAGRPLGGVPWLVASRFNDINPECE